MHLIRTLHRHEENVLKFKNRRTHLTYLKVKFTYKLISRWSEGRRILRIYSTVQEEIVNTVQTKFYLSCCELHAIITTS